MKDPYSVLGIDRAADEAAIQAAYRKLAKRHHPDLNKGDPQAAEKFKEINAANDLLSDPAKRARFDRGEIDADGNETMRGRGFHPGGGGAGGFSQDDIEAFMAHAFGGRRQGGPRRGTDTRYSLAVDFVEAAAGAQRRMALPDGRTLDVRIPPGTADGDVLRLRGQGRPGHGGGPPGDALIELKVAPHKLFRRNGDDIEIELPVTLKEAVLGCALDVPTIGGQVRLTVPPGSGTGTRLRLRGRGIREGHQYVTLRVDVPPGEEPELAAFLRDWTPAREQDPRAGIV
jgi:DnaJ-class molecular chaperone